MTHQNIWLFILYQNLWPFLGSRCPCWRQWRKTCPKGWQIGPHAEFCRVAHHWNQNFVGYNIVRPKHDKKCHCGQQWRPVVPKLSLLGIKLNYKRGNCIVRKYVWYFHEGKLCYDLLFPDMDPVDDSDEWPCPPRPIECYSLLILTWGHSEVINPGQSLKSTVKW